MRRSRPRRVYKVQLRPWSHVASRRYSGTANFLLEVSHPSPKFKDDPLFFPTSISRGEILFSSNNIIIALLVHKIFSLFPLPSRRELPIFNIFSSFTNGLSTPQLVPIFGYPLGMVWL